MEPEMQSQQESRALPHYNAVAKAFHWLVAVMVVVVWPLGLVGSVVDPDLSEGIFFWHKSLGFLILWLMLARLCVRFLTTTPGKPLGMPAWQAKLAGLNQWLLYLLLILQPLFGLLLVNGGGGQLVWFGLVPVWRLIGESGLGDVMDTLHYLNAWALFWLIMLHISGALYHRVIRRDDTLARMT